MCPLAHGLEFLNPKPLRNGARVVFFENDFKSVTIESIMRLSPSARDLKMRVSGNPGFDALNLVANAV